MKGHTSTFAIAMSVLVLTVAAQSASVSAQSGVADTDSVASFMPKSAIPATVYADSVASPVPDPAFTAGEYADNMEYSDTTDYTDLDEIVITADLQQREGTRDLITVTKSMQESSKNTGEMMGQVPGMFYNTLSDELIYRGSQNVIILVDGVKKDAGYIKRMKPDRFVKIEITNMPTGMYAGYDAVIDLKTKASYEGYEGAAIEELQVLPDDRNGKGKNLRWSRTAGQFTYTRGKINLDFIAVYTYMTIGMSDYYQTQYPLNRLSMTTLETPGRKPNETGLSNSWDGHLAFDYDINSNHSVSATFYINPYDIHRNYSYEIQRTFLNENRMDTVSETRDRVDRNAIEMEGGLWYRGKVSDWSINANINYNNKSYTYQDNIRRSSGYSLTDNRNISLGYLTGGADVSRKLADSKWELTLSEAIIASDYKENRAETGALLSQSSDLRNTVSASMQFIGTDRFAAGVDAGVSIFHNSFNGTSTTHVAPKGGVRFMWHPSRNLLVRGSYDLTAEYPYLSQLQDYGQFTDSLMYSFGNPYLKPVSTHAVSLSLTLFNSLTVEGRYSKGVNQIFNYYTTGTGLIPSGADTYYVKSGYVNGSQDTWSVNLTYAKAFGTHWTVSAVASVTGYRAAYGQQVSTRVLPKYDCQICYQIMNGTLQFYAYSSMLPEVQISPQLNQWKLESQALALAVSKTFCDNRLQIAASWIAPLNMRSDKWHGGITSESYTTRVWADNQWRANNRFSFSILYRFSGGVSVKKYNRESEKVEDRTSSKL